MIDKLLVGGARLADPLGPNFEFVFDLSTGATLDLRALAEADAAAADAAADEGTALDAAALSSAAIEPIDAWAYANADGSAAVAAKLAAITAALAGQGGSATGWDGSKLPGDLDNWPPAGWNGLDPSLDPTGMLAWKLGVGSSGTSSQAAAPGDTEEAPPSGTTRIGTAGDDVLTGTAGNDVVEGLGGDDVLYGGAGADVFRFAGDFGQDIVTGFTPGAAGGDVLEFDGVFTDFADVRAASRQVGTTVLIEVDDDTGIALLNVALASLNQDDFRFV